MEDSAKNMVWGIVSIFAVLMVMVFSAWGWALWYDRKIDQRQDSRRKKRVKRPQ